MCHVLQILKKVRGSVNRSGIRQETLFRYCDQPLWAWFCLWQAKFCPLNQLDMSGRLMVVTLAFSCLVLRDCIIHYAIVKWTNINISEIPFLHIQFLCIYFFANVLLQTSTGKEAQTTLVSTVATKPTVPAPAPGTQVGRWSGILITLSHTENWSNSYTLWPKKKNNNAAHNKAKLQFTFLSVFISSLI